MGVGVLDEIKAISAQLGLGFGLSLAKFANPVVDIAASSQIGVLFD